MSSRRRSIASKLTENEINELVSKLQAVLPQMNQSTNSKVWFLLRSYLVHHFQSHHNAINIYAYNWFVSCCVGINIEDCERNLQSHQEASERGGRAEWEAFGADGFCGHQSYWRRNSQKCLTAMKLVLSTILATLLFAFSGFSCVM